MADETQQHQLTIVVNGQPTEVRVHAEEKLRAVVAKALDQTGNTGQPPENWELRDPRGTPLDLDRDVDDFHFPAGTRLFLNLKAGIGG